MLDMEQEKRQHQDQLALEDVAVGGDQSESGQSQEGCERQHETAEEEIKIQDKKSRCSKCRQWGHKTPGCTNVSKHQLREIEKMTGAKVRKQKNKDFVEMVQELNTLVPPPEIC